MGNSKAKSKKQKVTTCQYFLSKSLEIWETIGFTRQRHLRCNETTITQEIVIDFWRMAKHNVLPIEIYEADNEKANGNDLEILIETKKGYLLLACQAKIIKKGDKYTEIDHKTKSGEQIDLLIDYARRRKGFAAYTFYNYSDDYLTIEKIEKETEADIGIYGWTIASAHYLKQTYYNTKGLNEWIIPTFGDLHPQNAIPMPILICNLLLDKLPTVLPYMGYKEDYDLKHYTSEELENDTYWRNLSPRFGIGRINLDDIPKQQFQKEPITKGNFDPKYRIVFSKKKKKFRISYVG
jgi:hypothetical protein